MKTTSKERQALRQYIADGHVPQQPCEDVIALLDDADYAERLEAALRRIIETDTHGKSDKDFCARCNRNSNHPHAADCPIELARAALAKPGAKK